MKLQRTFRIILCLALVLAFSALGAVKALSDDVRRITKEDLKALLDNPDVAILDVRSAKDWKASSLKIKGAHWEDFLEAETWSKKYPKDKTIVLYCA